MAGNKYLSQSGGALQEVAAIQTSAGGGDAGKIIALSTGGVLDTSMMPTGIGPDTQTVTASENLAAGDLVNIWNSSGAFKARKADGSTSGKEAHGFTLAAVTSGNPATVYGAGNNNAVTGLSPGPQYLSATTPGAATTTIPSGSGQTLQRVGVAGSATNLNFEPGTPIVLA